MLRLNKKTVIISAVVIAVFVLWTILPIMLLAQHSVKPRRLMFSDPPVMLFQPITCPVKFFGRF